MEKQYAGPTIIVIFGATGDLTVRKILPALASLFETSNLPDTVRIIGFSRRALTRHAYQEFVKEALSKKKIVPSPEFLALIEYSQGNFEEAEDYKKLTRLFSLLEEQVDTCMNKLFYLAVPPEHYRSIFKLLAESGLTEPCDEGSLPKVLVEKPFGSDLSTAEELDNLLGLHFKEKQIYRIDHYLAKEMLQNILTFRFSNSIFENIWNRNFINSIHIRLWEEIGVESRGKFYDGIGALRDVGQNHLLQIVALMAMKNPGEYETGKIRKNRAEVLAALKVWSPEEIGPNSLRAQHEGYREIDGVSANSRTETFFKLRAYIENNDWRGVPFILESGKRMREQRKEVEVSLRHPSKCLCGASSPEHLLNTIKFNIEPKEGIEISFWTKKPGLGFGTEKQTLNFTLKNKRQRIQYVEEYQKMLLDALNGDQTLFVTTSEVASMWKFIDPFIRSWQEDKVPLLNYTRGSSKIASQKLDQSAVVERINQSIGIIGLGKMGGNIAMQLARNNWFVYGFDKFIKSDQFKDTDVNLVDDLAQMKTKLESPRIFWLMLPAGKVIDEVLFGGNGLISLLDAGDYIIDGSNSFYKDTIYRHGRLRDRGIRYVDVGVSGGPQGALRGASLMIGGEESDFTELEALFISLADGDGYRFFPGVGAGHFVKMIHNGIEYGMMQAIAEGFDILKHAPYDLDLTAVASVYNNGSVIESRLIGWLEDAFKDWGLDLNGISGSVIQSGEGLWASQAATELKVESKIINASVEYRKLTENKPSYAGKILSALRNRFGGHDVKKK